MPFIVDKHRPNQVAGGQHAFGDELARPRIAAVAPQARLWIGGERRQKRSHGITPEDGTATAANIAKIGLKPVRDNAPTVERSLSVRGDIDHGKAFLPRSAGESLVERDHFWHGTLIAASQNFTGLPGAL
jgi:hypothetical protein